MGDGATRAAGLLRKELMVGVPYPPASNTPRWGYQAAPNAPLLSLLSGQHERFEAVRDAMGAYADDLMRIEREATVATEPSWWNSFLPALDSAAIYTFLRDRNPALYLEIGSGNTTKFAARAKRDAGLSTRIVSIDPHPRTEIDTLCDRVLRSGLEVADHSVFDELAPGDIVFLDGSHTSFMNSDVPVFFMELLPRIPEGVLVGVHDVYLPDDYPQDIADRYYTEQYVLAAYLLGGDRLTTEFPAAYVSRYLPASPKLAPLFASPNLRGVDTHGVAYWFTSRPL